MALRAAEPLPPAPRRPAPASAPERAPAGEPAGVRAAAQAAQAPLPAALAGWRAVERLFDRAFGSRANPLRQLGALGFLAFWLLAVSGIWLYIVFDTSIEGAHASIDALSRAPWSPSGLMRSLHRYATDAFVVFTALHLLRETLLGRWRHFRRFSWLTGAALLPLIGAAAIGGFWLVWDRLGQFSAIATAEWIDALPLLSTPIARNFLHAGAVSNRLFSLFVFIHIGVSLALVFGLWLHIQRITRAAVFPPRALALGTVGTLLVLCAVCPVAGQGPADLAQVPAVLSLDWFVLFVHPLMDASSPGLLWALAIGALLALLALPFLPAGAQAPRYAGAPASLVVQRGAAARAPVAVVDAANCNGCRRCFADCPYAAVTMIEHPNKRIGRELARVDADLCASCGICAGACPSSTPFRSAAELVTGIDLPASPIGALRTRLRDGLAPLKATGARPIVVFSCIEGAAPPEGAPDVLVLPLLCAGQLPPSFVEYAQRDGAAAVLVASCRDGGCAYRLGAHWTTERLAGVREPQLRARARERPLVLVQADAGERVPLAAALAQVRADLNRFNVRDARVAII